MNHIRYDCKKKCKNFYCAFCEGGLFACVVCGGFEGTLTTDCPGIRQCDALLELVYMGKIDYHQGRGWIKPDGTGTSMGDADVYGDQTKEGSCPVCRAGKPDCFCNEEGDIS